MIGKEDKFIENQGRRGEFELRFFVSFSFSAKKQKFYFFCGIIIKK